MRLTVDPLSNEDVRVQQEVDGPLYWFLLFLFWLVIIGVVIGAWELANGLINPMEPTL